MFQKDKNASINAQIHKDLNTKFTAFPIPTALIQYHLVPLQYNSWDTGKTVTQLDTDAIIRDCAANKLERPVNLSVIMCIRGSRSSLS